MNCANCGYPIRWDGNASYYRHTEGMCCYGCHYYDSNLPYEDNNGHYLVASLEKQPFTIGKKISDKPIPKTNSKPIIDIDIIEMPTGRKFKQVS